MTVSVFFLCTSFLVCPALLVSRGQGLPSSYTFRHATCLSEHHSNQVTRETPIGVKNPSKSRQQRTSLDIRCSIIVVILPITISPSRSPAFDDLSPSIRLSPPRRKPETRLLDLSSPSGARHTATLTTSFCCPLLPVAHCRLQPWAIYSLNPLGSSVVRVGLPRAVVPSSIGQVRLFCRSLRTPSSVFTSSTSSVLSRIVVSV